MMMSTCYRQPCCLIVSVLMLAVSYGPLVESLQLLGIAATRRSCSFSIAPRSPLPRLYSTITRTTEAPTHTGTTTTAPMPQSAWDCDDQVNTCTSVPACDASSCRTSLDVRIHDTWYDLSGWRKGHPAGSHWIDWYDGRDATEVMDAFHSQRGREMYQRLPKSNPQTVQLLQSITPPDSPIQIGFRLLRQQLEQEGWWQRDLWHEIRQLGIWATLVVTAAMTAHSTPVLSASLLGLSMTAAGWLGHDYIHGIDPFADRMRLFASVAAGLSPTWWSDKHNKHHALTNEQGVDEDIATDPVLYTWAPDPSQDSPLRKIQHYIFWIPFAALFALWRVDSVQVAIQAVENKRPNAKAEVYCLFVHYIVLLTLFPIHVWVPAVLLSGLLTSLIVTPTHQSEAMFVDHPSDWVTAQFLSTRNAITTNPFSEWLWGGMQYQLEHHLFPSMPRNRYPALKGQLQQFAVQYNIPGGYRESGEFEILLMNWDMYRRVAEADAVPGAPLTKGAMGQIAAICNHSNRPAAAAFPK